MVEYLVFTGRPNAGKSSIIRGITGINAPSGKRPGTTRRISEYPLSDGLVLVDMPGYGRITGAPKRMESRVKDQILEFLESNAGEIALTVHVLDISTFREVSRRLEEKGFVPLDLEMIGFLRDTLNELPVVVANKVDKATRQELDDALEELSRRIGVEDGDAGDVIFPVSARTGEGLGALKSAVHAKLALKGYRTPFAR